MTRGHTWEGEGREVWARADSGRRGVEFTEVLVQTTEVQVPDGRWDRNKSKAGRVRPNNSGERVTRRRSERTETD